jgi:hypothetical protein
MDIGVVIISFIYYLFLVLFVLFLVYFYCYFIYFIVFYYFLVGGWLPTGELELQSKQNGSVQMIVPAHYLLTDLYISSPELHISKLKQLSRFFYSPYHNDFLEIDARLFQAQWSEFCGELFVKVNKITK